MGTLSLISSFVNVSTFLIIIHLASSKAIHEVHEVINEQARSDENFKMTSGPANIPYGNPLAGNSQQNARLHAKNQQAMFNAERMRQHRAQIQRWNKAPLPLDSYIKAYRDSQDNHHLAIEQHQANLKDKKLGTASNPITKSTHESRGETLKRGVKVIPEILKLPKGDGINEKTRNHRSYGSTRYRNFVQPKRYKSVYLSLAPTYDQGVSIKPNGNIGLTSLKSSVENSKLYTTAIPSKTSFIYPKHYRQMQSYESANDIEALTELLNKSPQTQMSALNSLVNPFSSDSKSVLDTPIDLYFYMKDPIQTSGKGYEHTYEDAPPTYASAYMPQIKDHIPTTENVVNIENQNEELKMKPYTLESLLGTPTPLIETSTKSNDFFNVEVTSQIPEFKPIEIGDFLQEEPGKVDSYGSPNEQYLKNPKVENSFNSPVQPSFKHPKTGGVSYDSPIEPSFEKHKNVGYSYDSPAQLSLNSPKNGGYSYKSPAEEYFKTAKIEGDLSEKYLHHNAQHQGIQHLSGDGKGISAYGDESLQYAANYEFGYRVRDLESGNDYGHSEAQNEGQTNGQYHVLLPDGRLQKVQYSAGPEGFHADISYDHLKAR